MTRRKGGWAKPAKNTPDISGWSVPENPTTSADAVWWDEHGNEIIAVKQKPTTGDDWDTYEEPKAKLTKKEEAEAKIQQRKAEKKAKIDKKLAGWPWQGAPKKLATVGPLYLNTWDGKRPRRNFHDQPQNPLMKVLVTSGVGELIIDLLFQHHATIWKFAHCCQKVHATVKATLDFWDINIEHFNGCERDPNLTARASKGKGLVASNLVVSPMRSPPAFELQKKNTLYENQLYNTYLLCKTVKYRAIHFRRLHLHRVPFLTTGLLSILIPEMKNLEVLGIYKCPLIHIGNGMELLDIISRGRPKGKKHQVHLDWYPNHHIGPNPDVCPPHHHTGSYGATWDDWHGPTDRAIWALALPFLARCKACAIDAMSSYTQFRRWLEAGPCWDVENTLKAFVVAWGLYVEGSDLFGKDEVPVWAPEPRFPRGRRRKPVPKLDYKTKWPKLTNAIILIDQRSPLHRGDHGKFFDTSCPMTHVRPEGFEWMFKLYPCTCCENELEGVFFFFPDIKYYVESTNHGMDPNAGSDLQCLGCKLSKYLDTEKDHFKFEKRKIDMYWRLDLERDDEHRDIAFNTSDIDKLLANYKPDVILLAQALDEERKVRRETLLFDRETEERQYPLTAQVARSKRGDFLNAPRIGDWETALAERARRLQNPEEARYADGVRTSWLRHGRSHG